MTAQELDDVYSKLCHALTSAGEDKTAQILARLVLLLMQRSQSPQEFGQAIDDAVEGMLT